MTVTYRCSCQTQSPDFNNDAIDSLADPGGRGPGSCPQTSHAKLRSVRPFYTKSAVVNVFVQLCVKARLCSKNAKRSQIVIRRIFRARSVPKCVCHRGCAPNHTGETYIILTTSSVVPGCVSIVLLVPSLSIFSYSAPRPHA